VALNLRLSRTFGFGPKTAAAQAAAAAAAARRGCSRRRTGRACGPGGPGGAGGRVVAAVAVAAVVAAVAVAVAAVAVVVAAAVVAAVVASAVAVAQRSNTGRKYNLTLGAFAQNLFNRGPVLESERQLEQPQFGKTTSIQGGNSVRRITLQANSASNQFAEQGGAARMLAAPPFFCFVRGGCYSFDWRA